MQRGQAKMGGGVNFTRAVPDFLSQMGRGGTVPDVGGIAGALQREERKAELSHPRGEAEGDAEEAEDEAPLVVDALDALPLEARKKLEAKSSGSGTLRFKGDPTSAAAKFRDAAADRVAAEEERRAAMAQEAETASGGKIVFKPGVDREKKKKRKHDGTVGAKPLKNTKLLSFAAEDDEE